MKILFTLLVTLAFTANTSLCQSGFQDQAEMNPTSSHQNKIKSKSNRTAEDQAKQISTDFIALSGYGEGGATIEIPFRFHLDNEDLEYGDSLSMTFPEGFTILAVSNDDIFGVSYDNPGGTDGDPEEFNGIDGQTVSWGDNDNTYGGISTVSATVGTGPYYHFTVTVSIDESVAGTQTIDYHISGDQFGDDPGDLDGTITLEDGLSVAGIICSSEDHNTLQTAIYAAGIMYGLGPATPELTIFAPTDNAFDALPEGLLEELLADPDGALRNALFYHGATPDILTDDMFDGQEIFSGLVDPVTITFEGDDIYVNDALIIVEDIIATNGVVHAIDAVLLPPDPVSPVTLPLNFQLPSLSYDYLGFEGAFSQIQPNPDPSGVNTSTIVMRSIKTEGALFYAGTFINLDEPIDFSSSSAISMSSWSPKLDIPVLMRLEDENNTSGVQLSMSTSVMNEWETLTFNFEGLLDPEVDYVRVVIFYEFVNGLEGDGTTYYFDNIAVGDPLSITNTETIHNYRLFPNPANEQIAVEFQMTQSNDLTIDVLNILGQNVKSFDFGTRSAGFNRELLDVNDLPEGMYILNITVGNDQATTKLQITR